MPGDEVLSLPPDQIFAVSVLRSIVRVAGKCDARARIFVGVAEHHRLDRHGRPKIVRDPVMLPIGLGPRTVPGPEHRFDREFELLGRIRRSRPSPLRARERGRRTLERFEGLQDGAARARRSAFAPPRRARRIQVQNRIEEHPPEAQPGVEAKRGARPLERRITPSARSAEVEDRVHHAGHADRGAGPHGHEQRPIDASKRPSGRRFKPAQGVLDLGHHVRRRLSRRSTENDESRPPQSRKAGGTGTPRTSCGSARSPCRRSAQRRRPRDRATSRTKRAADRRPLPICRRLRRLEDDRERKGCLHETRTRPCGRKSMVGPQT